MIYEPYLLTLMKHKLCKVKTDTDLLIYALQSLNANDAMNDENNI